jgi:hypothetical protein
LLWVDVEELLGGNVKRRITERKRMSDERRE